MDRPNVLLVLEDQLRYDVVDREELDLLQIMHETEDPLRQWAVNVLA